MKKTLIFIAFTVFGAIAHAGPFTCHAFMGDTPYDCGKLIADVVTDEFTKKFPDSRFQIVVISNSTRYASGTSSGYATAGVSPAGNAVVPHKRYSALFSNQDKKTVAQIGEDEKNAVREAVGNLVAAESNGRRNTPRSSRAAHVEWTPQERQEDQPQPHYPQIVCKQPEHVGDMQSCGYE